MKLNSTLKNNFSIFYFSYFVIFCVGRVYLFSYINHTTLLWKSLNSTLLGLLFPDVNDTNKDKIANANKGLLQSNLLTRISNQYKYRKQRMSHNYLLLSGFSFQPFNLSAI